MAPRPATSLPALASWYNESVKRHGGSVGSRNGYRSTGDRGRRRSDIGGGPVDGRGFRGAAPGVLGRRRGGPPDRLPDPGCRLAHASRRDDARRGPPRRGRLRLSPGVPDPRRRLRRHARGPGPCRCGRRPARGGAGTDADAGGGGQPRGLRAAASDRRGRGCGARGHASGRPPGGDAVSGADQPGPAGLGHRRSAASGGTGGGGVRDGGRRLRDGGPAQLDRRVVQDLLSAARPAAAIPAGGRREGAADADADAHAGSGDRGGGRGGGRGEGVDGADAADHPGARPCDRAGTGAGGGRAARGRRAAAPGHGGDAARGASRGGAG